MSNYFSRAKGDMKYLFKSSSKLNEKNKRRKKRAILTTIGLVIVCIQLIASVLLGINLAILNLLPMKYYAMLLIVLILILLYDFLSQFTKAHIFGKCLAVIMSGILIFGTIVAGQISSTLKTITKTTTQTDVIDIIVLADDKAQSIADTLDYTFGFNAEADGTLAFKAVEIIQNDNNTTLKVGSYSEWESLINALYDGKDINAMIVSNALYPTLTEQFEDFSTKTKIVGTVEIVTEVQIEASNKNVTNESFIIYISGNDGYGSISDTGRSDVNILVTVNPKTRQILLVSTPRDYYVTISNGKGKTGLDKLTHAGVAGTKYSIQALEDLYRINVDYYCKVNFSGCVDIVDAVGGITINSSVEFTNGTDAAPIRYHFVKGPNECNGAKTLAFVRERHTFAQGDLQRGRNQMAAIQGIIDKVTSPAILANYAAVLDAGSKMVITNMPTSTITDLIKAQIADPSAWNIQTYSAAALRYDNLECYVYNYKSQSVVIPDYTSVNTAIKLMNMTYNGEAFDVNDYTNATSPQVITPTPSPKPTQPSTQNTTEAPTERSTEHITTEPSSAKGEEKTTESVTKPTNHEPSTASSSSASHEPSSSTQAHRPSVQ